MLHMQRKNASAYLKKGYSWYRNASLLWSPIHYGVLSTKQRIQYAALHLMPVFLNFSHLSLVSMQNYRVYSDVPMHCAKGFFSW